MSAVVVQDVYKKFGKPGDSLWKRILRLNARDGAAKTTAVTTDSVNIPATGHNGNGNGHSENSMNTLAETLVLTKADNNNGKSNGVAQTGNGAAQTGSGAATNGTAKNGKEPEKKMTVAVNHVSFTVEKGEIFGVLGPNGGGKSTLIRLISTLLLPDSGKVYVFGYDVEKHPMEVQKLINRVSVEASFFKKLSPMENLLYGARLYGLEAKETRKQVNEILTRLGLEKRSIYSPMEEMSRGMQQKVAIARALLSHPKLLLLDEPTTGLDPRSKREVQAVVRELRETYQTTILLTTHDMNEAEMLCDRIAIMDSGRIVALDTPTGLKKLIQKKDGTEVTLEDVFLELTGKKLVNREEEPEPVEENAA